MRSPRFKNRRRTLANAVVAALAAIVVAATGLEAAAHGHLPGHDGWHDASPHGASARDEGLKSCSICRLAHETSSAPVAPRDLAQPQRAQASPVFERSARPAVVLAAEHSPRAPPSAPSC